ncbi:MAG: class II fructose-bisphosphate aldolase [Provencibacterium sp.]|jgi:fructose-bisphosphate aldolase class II|nr:class II fructose-bisphosphate aldolase [Provencibacterium sp.]
MSIVTLKELLGDARQQHYGVGMFDVLDLEMTNAVIEAAESERSPVILALAEVHVHSLRELKAIGSILLEAARNSRVPVAVHYDHGMDRGNLLRVMQMGFSSVMLDASMLPYEENIRQTADIVQLAKSFGCSVEAELGHVGGCEGGCAEDGSSYTHPGQAADFIRRTGVDALAVSIGTVHGVYRAKPCLDLKRLQEITGCADVPLVLHGASGLSDEDICRCIQGGITKINIYTELVQAAGTAIFGAMEKGGGTLSYPKMMKASVNGMREKVAAKMRLFGSSGRV